MFKFKLHQILNIKEIILIAIIWQKYYQGKKYIPLTGCKRELPILLK